MLEIQGLTKMFGGVSALSNVSFSLEAGSFVGLIGPNGSGKTTVFNLVSGALKPTQGRIVFDGEVITGNKPNLICHAGIARTFQIPQPITSLTLLENVMLGSAFGSGKKHVYSESGSRRKALEMLEFVGLEEDPNGFPQKMTAVNLRKLELARALATEPLLLLADEVLSGLNRNELSEASRILKRIRDGLGITIIWVEHIMHVLMSLVERVIVLNHGMKIADGTPETVSSDPKVIEAYLGRD